MSAATTLLLGAIRNRVLDFDPTGAVVALRTTLTGGLHTHAPPDNVVYPFGFLRLGTRRTGELDDSRLEEVGEVEVVLVGRHRQQLAVIEEAMDTCEQALMHWSTDQVGWLAIRRLASRLTLPPFPQVANAEIVQVRGVWRYTWWPDYRTKYAVAAGASAP
jgi:hypothetical protein